MSCKIEDNNNRQTLDLIFNSNNKGYSPEVLNKLVTKIDQTKAWLLSSVGDVNQDLIALRIGTPTLTRSFTLGGNVTIAEESLSQEIYKTEFTNDDFLVTPFIGIDYIKITSRAPPMLIDGNYIKSTNFRMYRYESPYVHKVFGNYFVKGIYNGSKPKIPDDKFISKLKQGLLNEYVPYLDNLQVGGVKAKTGILPVRYDDELGLPEQSFNDIPQFVVDAITLISQNIYLFAGFSEIQLSKVNLDRVVIGETYVNTVSGFIQALDRVRAKALDRLSRFATSTNLPYYYIREEILSATGVDESFKSLRYGGGIESARLFIRIPASYRKEKELRDYLEIRDCVEAWNLSYPSNTITDYTCNDSHMNWYFNQVFPVQVVTRNEVGYSEKDLEDNPKRFDVYDKQIVQEALNRRIAGRAANYEDLYTINDWYDTNYLINQVINVTPPSMSDSTKGGMYTSSYMDNTGDEPVSVEVAHIRLYRVNQAWFRDKAPMTVKISLLYAGLDINTDGNPCPADKFIAVVVAVAISIFASPEAGAKWYMWAMWAIATIISIGLSMGVWQGKQARNLAILAALATAGQSLASTASSTASNSLLMKIITLSQAAINIYNVWEGYKFEKQVKKHEKELSQITEDAELYESNLRYVYGESYTTPIRNSCERDPYQSIKDSYAPYSSYKTEGFKGSGFDRPGSYGWG